MEEEMEEVEGGGWTDRLGVRVHPREVLEHRLQELGVVHHLVDRGEQVSR